MMTTRLPGSTGFAWRRIRKSMAVINRSLPGIGKVRGLLGAGGHDTKS
jgi:hypothetical protein